MTRTEYIIWRAETREALEGKYPEFSQEQIEGLLRQLEMSYAQLGFINAEDINFRRNRKEAK